MSKVRAQHTPPTGRSAAKPRTISTRRRGIIGLALACALLFVAGCGAGSTPISSQGSGPTTSVTGTAALGAPIANAPVTLIDAAGKSSSATSAQDGTYSLNTTGMTPPFLIRVQGLSGTLYSVSADTLSATTINTDVYTDLIVRSWYLAQGQSPDAAFANPVAVPAPSPSNVQIISGVVLQTILVWLQRAGINTLQFNLILTPFVANGTGFDGVLHDSALNLSTGRLTISDGTTTQTSMITNYPETATLAISSTTTNARGSSVNFVSTVIPAQAALQAAVNGIGATMANFAATINAKGSQLADTDVLPLVASDTLNDGWNQSVYAGILAGSSRYPTGSALQFQVHRIASLDLTTGQAEVAFGRTLNINGLPAASTIDQAFYFEKSGSEWLIAGDKQPCSLSFSQGSGFIVFGNPAPAVPTLGASAQCSQGLFSGLTVTGGGIWNATALTKALADITLFYSPTPGTNLQLPVDLFSTPSVTLSGLMPAGTPFTFTATPVSGPAVNSVIPSPPETDERIAITSPATTSLSQITLGEPLQVTWTAPTTFPADTVLFFATASSNIPGPLCQVAPAGLPGSATSNTITIPSACNGGAVTVVNISITVLGVNGESAATALTLQ
jgi:hypothetical protein